MIPLRSLPTLAISLAALAFIGWMFASSPTERPLYARSVAGYAASR